MQFKAVVGRLSAVQRHRRPGVEGERCHTYEAGGDGNYAELRKKLSRTSGRRGCGYILRSVIADNGISGGIVQDLYRLVDGRCQSRSRQDRCRRNRVVCGDDGGIKGMNRRGPLRVRLRGAAFSRLTTKGRTADRQESRPGEEPRTSEAIRIPNGNIRIRRCRLEGFA